MACGLPVVTKHISGITDFIFTNNSDGLILDSEDPESYLKVIRRILDDSKLRDEIINNALNTVKEKFMEKVIYKNYFDIFNRVLRS